MGFRVKKREALLRFADGSALDGAEISVSLSLPIRDFLDLQRSISGVSRGEDSIDMDAVREAYVYFGDHVLHSWNLEDEDGNAIAADGEGFLSLPQEEATLVMQEWSKVIAGNVPNSSAASANGAASGAEYAAMGPA